MQDWDVRILSRDDHAEWDALVGSSSLGTIFHTSTWQTTCADILSLGSTIYGYYRRGELVGGCSLYWKNRLHLLRTAVSSAPMAPYGGYVLAPPKSSKVRENERFNHSIIGEINREITEAFDHITIVHPPEFTDIRPFIWTGWDAGVHYAYYFGLREPVEERLSKDARWVVRKARKLDVSFGKESDPALYYELMKKTYEKQDRPLPYPQPYVSGMIDMIVSKGLGEVWVARTPSGEPAAAEIIIWDTHRAYRWSAALDPEFRDTGATSLLLYEIFNDLRGRGFHEINLMAGNKPHLTKFITGFNPRLVPYYSLERAKRLPHLLALLSRSVRRDR